MWFKIRFKLKLAFFKLKRIFLFGTVMILLSFF
jgi:hypothetical protein